MKICSEIACEQFMEFVDEELCLDFDVVEKCQQSRGVVDMPFWFPSGLTEVEGDLDDEEEEDEEEGEEDNEDESSEESESETESSEGEEDESGTEDDESEEDSGSDEDETASESEYSDIESSKYYPQIKNWVGNVDSTQAVHTDENAAESDGTLEYNGSETATEESSDYRDFWKFLTFSILIFTTRKNATIYVSL